MPITALYAALLVPILVVLSVRVIGLRRSSKVAVGDGGEATLVRRMRVQANFAEYVPFALVLMALAESLKLDPRLLHAIGIALVVARLVHAYGMSQPQEVFALRVTGMALTFTVLISAGLACLVLAV